MDSNVAEDASSLYAEAARRTVLALPMSAPIARLLAHLDNRIDRLIDLIAGMLAHRDQWLPWLVAAASQPDLRAELERNWRVVIEHELAEADRSFPHALKASVIRLAGTAHGNLRDAARLSANAIGEEFLAWPQSAAEHAQQWTRIANFVLTKEGTPRRKVSVAHGFPAASGATGEERERRARHKGAMEALLSALREAPDWVGAWTRLQRLPNMSCPPDQWDAVAALLSVLPVAVAQLRLVFTDNDRSDFVEVALAALQVLGDANAPGDLLLAYDQRIAHVLVDEFQDTSLSQFGLIARLTAGWEDGDGRTLFAVGDPMQSVYRFRGAEVGLFLAAQKDGLSAVPLQPIRLRVNFRSQAPLVEWVNRVFAQVLPAADRPEEGAASFVSATAAPKASVIKRGSGVHLHAMADSTAQGEAVVRLVRKARAADPDGTIAVLVRARGHLRTVIPALRSAGLGWQAVDIDPLAAKQPIIDCMALTHALLEPADRLSWLAVLRAPWCGLTLSDLTRLTDGLGGDPVLLRLQSPDLWAGLSDDAQLRLGRCAPVLVSAAARAANGALAQAAESAWLRLGGPPTLVHAGDAGDVERYWRLLTDYAAEPAFDWPEFEAAVDRLYGESTPAVAALDTQPLLQIMTMHRAKGLQFDTVIVPGLAQGSGRADPPLLHWRAGRDSRGQRTLLLAPIQQQGSKDNAQYDYLRRRSHAEERHELARLLYVAATRARHTLHWIAVLPPGANPYKPPAESALSLLWPVLANEWPRLEPPARQEAFDFAPSDVPSQSLSRLAPDWQPLPLADRVPAPATRPEAVALEPVVFDWAQDTARAVGIVAHEFLRRIGDDGLALWDADRLARARPALRVALAEEGVPPEEIDEALERVARAVATSLGSARGRWLFDEQHADARSEFALTTIEDGLLLRIVVDRTFVDAAGVRWIVDFKTSAHRGGDLEQFLDNEFARHREQLERYARIWQRIEQRPVRLGLYWPLHDGWREWSPQ